MTMTAQTTTIENSDRSSHVLPHNTGGIGQFGRVLWRFIRRKPLAAFGGAIILALFVIAALAPILATHDPGQTQPRSKWAMPGEAGHNLGADHLGRDIFSRVVHGGRVSLTIGFGVAFVAMVFATLIGVTSGYYGGWFDSVFQRGIDIAISFPALILLITVLQVVPKSSGNWSLAFISVGPSGQKAIYMIITLGIVLSFNASRVVRGAVVAMRERQYVEAARTVGANDFRILTRYILPNIMATLIVLGTVYLGSAILIESSLAFLGFGLPPTIPSWGQMLNEARPGLSSAVNPSIWPGLAISLTVWAFNMLGDGLRDVLDPRLRGSR
jgi:peptide/nickel transport system permease protein